MERELHWRSSKAEVAGNEKFGKVFLLFTEEKIINKKVEQFFKYGKNSSS